MKLGPTPGLCRVKPCHDPDGCYRAGYCQYTSSAEESNEVRALGTTNLPGSVIPMADPFGLLAGMDKRASALPSSTKERKEIPLARGVLDYFPAALAAIARHSKAGNDKHNPGQDIHWARGKSMDHADCIMRHLIDRGTIDPETGDSHTVSLAWRALALLQEEEEAKGAPMSRGSRNA